MQFEDFQHTRYNVVGLSTQVRGEIHFFGRSSISGTIEGKVIAEVNSLLILERTARVKGEMNAHDVEIHGEFEGDLVASGTVKLRPGCLIKGRIKAVQLVVYPGASLDLKADAEP